MPENKRINIEKVKNYRRRRFCSTCLYVQFYCTIYPYLVEIV